MDSSKCGKKVEDTQEYQSGNTCFKSALWLNGQMYAIDTFIRE